MKDGATRYGVCRMLEKLLTDSDNPTGTKQERRGGNRMDFHGSGPWGMAVWAGLGQAGLASHVGCTPFSRPPFWLPSLSSSATGHNCLCASSILPPQFNSGGLCLFAQARRRNTGSSVDSSKPQPSGSFSPGVSEGRAQFETWISVRLGWAGPHLSSHLGLTHVNTACQSWHAVRRPHLHSLPDPPPLGNGSGKPACAGRGPVGHSEGF